MSRDVKRLWFLVGTVLSMVCFFQCEYWVKLIMGRKSFWVEDMASMFSYMVFHRLYSLEPDIGIFINATWSIIVFNILYGCFIFDELQGGGIYYFIRYRSRTRWYIYRILKILKDAFVFHILYIGVQYIFSLKVSCETISFHNVVMLFSYTLYFTVLCFMITLITNFMSGRFGRVVALIVAFIILALARWLTLLVANATIIGTEIKVRALIPLNLTLDREGLLTVDTWMSIISTFLVCCILIGVMYCEIRSENVGLVCEESHV